MTRTMCIVAAATLYTIIWIGSAFSQDVVHLNDETKSLTERVASAHAEAHKKNFDRGYWIGYTIQRLMDQNTFIGTFYSSRNRNKPSLCEVVTGKSSLSDELPSMDDDGFTSSEGILSFDNVRAKQVQKEVAILLHYDDREAPDGAVVSNVALHVDLEGDPLIWIYEASDRQSIDFLSALFDKTEDQEAKEKLIMAVSMHQDTERSMTFLKRVLTDGKKSSFREEAAFWIGQTDRPEGLPLLVHAIDTDASPDVREKAVFSISQMNGEAATDALISLARSKRDEEIRNKAIFWLSQKATEKAVGALEDFADDENESVQKSAVFALSQLPDNAGIEPLIKLAQTHKSRRVRKEAIFWLGQSEDPRAVDVLVDMLKK